MVRVHVLDDFRFRFHQALRTVERKDELRRGEIEDAPEAADIVRALDIEPPESEVGEAGIEGGLRMPGEKAPLQPLIHYRLGPAMERDPRPLQGIGERARLVDQDRSPGIGGEIRGMAGERRDKEGGCAGCIRRERDERGIRVAAGPVDGGEGALEGASHEGARVAGDLGSVGDFH